jgi:hypothetical protein
MTDLRKLFTRALPRPFLVLAAATVGLYVTAVLVLMPPFDTMGDAPTYLQAMQVLNGMTVPEVFTPNRLVATFGSVSSVALLSFLSGNYLASWFFINTLYFFGLAFVSYFLFRRITGSDAGSVIGALFVVGNYDVLTFGLNYLMDSSGWFWFMVSLLATFLYMEREDRRLLWGAALAAGVGTLFKEYAFFGFAPLGLYLLYRHWREPHVFFRNLVPLIVSLLPMVAVNIGVYVVFGYSYLDWYGMNATVFAWNDYAWNAARSYMVALSFLTPLAILGAFAFAREMRQNFDTKRVLFVAALLVPALAVLGWPIITERLVFLAVPLAALLTAYAVKHHERYTGWFAFVWLLYVVLALKTDALILNYLYSL